MFGLLSSRVGQLSTWWVCKRESDQELPISELLSQALPLMKKEYRRYPLSETADAIRYLEDGHAKGKVIISIEQNNNWHCFPKIMTQIDSILPCRISMLSLLSFFGGSFLVTIEQSRAREWTRVGVVLGRAVGMDLSNRSWWVRAGINLAYLVIGLAMTIIAKRVLAIP